MNIVTVDGKIEVRDIWIHGVSSWQSRLVYIGNICRILELREIDKKCIVSYVKRGLYELFSNRKIMDEHLIFVMMLYPETYMCEFISDNVGYSLKLDTYPRPIMFPITHLDTHQLFISLSDTTKSGVGYLRACSKIPSLQCYRILMDVVDGKKADGLDDFLNFGVRRLEDGDNTDDYEEYSLNIMLGKQMETVKVFEDAIDEYNDCCAPLDLIMWYDKYSLVYSMYFGGEIPNANDIANTFFYSTKGDKIPNHNNIK